MPRPVARGKGAADHADMVPAASASSATSFRPELPPTPIALAKPVSAGAMLSKSVPA